MKKVKTIYVLRHLTWDQIILTILCKITRHHKMSLVCEDLWNEAYLCNTCLLSVVTYTTVDEKSSLLKHLQQYFFKWLIHSHNRVLQ